MGREEEDRILRFCGIEIEYWRREERDARFNFDSHLIVNPPFQSSFSHKIQPPKKGIDR